MHDRIASLLAHPAIQAARDYLEGADASILARQAELSAIPAPSGGEGTRAARVAELFRAAGFPDVTVDAAGNVLAWHDREVGSGKRDTPVVLSAHLDTVFGPEVNVAVRRHGARLEGPGISDNARGLAALLAVAAAMTQAKVATARPVLFAATVGEEGAGNLRGVRHLLDGGASRPSAFIALDGAGIGRIIHRALGSRRYRVTYRGPGGHSWAAFGIANPANAVGRAVAALAELPMHHAPRTTCAVVGLGGGTGLNSIPQEAWIDVDLRSEDPQALVQLDQAAQGAIARAGEEENRRRAAGTPPLTCDLQLVGDRPSGVTPRAHSLVQTAIAATRALGREPELACASTDANVPISLGVPAIALGAGGQAGDQHLPTEWYDNAEGPLGMVRALLVTAAMAELR